MASKAKTSKLSCREARLILRIVPMRKTFTEMTKDGSDAVKHYACCKRCRDLGLERILDTKLTCQAAILRWAENACAMWLSHGETLMDEYAVEHVWGKYQWKNSIGGHGYDTYTGCHERPCQTLHSYWASIPMSSSAGDGPGGVIYLFPILIKIFLNEGWPLDELLAIQKKRAADVLNDIKNGKVTVSGGHYHSIDELMLEMREHIALLQKLAVHSQT